MGRDVDTAATAIEQGKGCEALDRYLLNQSHSIDEWKDLLKEVLKANAKHVRSDPTVPSLTIVERDEPEWIPGTRVGITRQDLLDRPDTLVDRIFGLRGKNDIPRSYDCYNLKKQ